MWLAWTIAGCMAFVLALLASGIIVHAAMKARKVRLPSRVDSGGSRWHAVCAGLACPLNFLLPRPALPLHLPACSA
jgi:hypothetical protein